MDQWIEVAKTYGLPGLILLALGAFLYFKGWPLLIKQLEDAQTQRKAEIDKFDSTIRARDQLLVQQWQEHLKALDSITTEIRGLRADIQPKTRTRTRRK